LFRPLDGARVITAMVVALGSGASGTRVPKLELGNEVELELGNEVEKRTFLVDFPLTLTLSRRERGPKTCVFRYVERRLHPK
jgi:hypothetical protein